MTTPTIRIRQTGRVYRNATWFGHSWMQVRVLGGWLYFGPGEFDVLPQERSMSYYPTLAEDLARAKMILAEGRPTSDTCGVLLDHTTTAAVRGRILEALGGTIFGKDVYAAYKLLESFVAAIEHPDHSHCECRTSECGHIDLRHEGGKCSFPGCKCGGWS